MLCVKKHLNIPLKLKEPYSDITKRKLMLYLIKYLFIEVNILKIVLVINREGIRQKN